MEGKGFCPCYVIPRYPLKDPKHCLFHFTQLEVSKFLDPMKLCCVCFAPTISGTYTQNEIKSLYCCLLCAKKDTLDTLMQTIPITGINLIVVDYLFKPLEIGTILGTIQRVNSQQWYETYIKTVDEQTYTYHIDSRMVLIAPKCQYPNIPILTTHGCIPFAILHTDV